MKTNSNTKSELLNRTEQLSTAKTSLAKINYAHPRVNRSLDTETLLALLRGTAPRFCELAEVVGKWVWIQFSAKQPPEITSRLAQLGFHWNHSRQAWQRPCGLHRDRRVACDPRKKFGSTLRPM